MKRSHSILLSGNINIRSRPGEHGQLPYKLKRNIESLIHFHPDFHHRLWQDEDVERLLREEFDPEVLDAYHVLVPLAYKADLARYCILHHCGGLYADLSVLFFQSLFDAIQLKTLGQPIFFRDAFNHSAPWIVSNSLIYAPPRYSLFTRCIRRIVENVKRGFYGSTPLDPTGPNMVGIQLAMLHEDQPPSFSLGEVRREAEESGGKWTLAYYMNNHSLVALINKDSNGLSSLGIERQENYGKLWRARAIYRTAHRPACYTYTDYLSQGWIASKFKIQDRGLQISPKAEELLVYGPYLSLKAGSYRVHYDVDLPSFSGISFHARITARAGQHILAEGIYELKQLQGHACELVYDFAVNEAIEDAEFLLICKENANPDAFIVFKSLRISGL